MKTDVLKPREASPALSSSPHGTALARELQWLKDVIDQRVAAYFAEQPLAFETVPAPSLDSQSYYGQLVAQYRLCAGQRLSVILALAAEIAPQSLDILQTKNKLYDLPFAEFGGLLNTNHSGFQPTIQTAVFLLAGADPQARWPALALFEADQTLLAENILKADASVEGITRQPLRLSEEIRQRVLTGRETPPQYSADFPAALLRTEYCWENLILPASTAAHLQEVELWLKHHARFLNDWGMSKTQPRGYKALFYGPPGTGKSLTATLLGKKLDQPVYRIDLSQIVSKYIGETEKNLARVFQKAHAKQWILFFDEADALFGKRVGVNNANDRHANQETAYLLQRIESCENLVILASNLKDNIDEAFLRRFQSIIHFPTPGVEERLKLWRQGFSEQADLREIDLAQLAYKYELSGAEINQVIRFCCLMALERQEHTIAPGDVLTAIRREKFKGGKFV